MAIYQVTHEGFLFSDEKTGAPEQLRQFLCCWTNFRITKSLLKRVWIDAICFRGGEGNMMSFFWSA